MTNAPELIFVGIDVSKGTLELGLDDRSKTQCLDNDEAGVKALVAQLEVVAPRVALVVLEATGGFEMRAVLALCAAGFKVVVANPRNAKSFGKSLGRLAKTDSLDARALSRYAKTLYDDERLDQKLFKVPSAEQEALLALVTRRGQLVGIRVAEGNRLDTAHVSQRKSIKALMKVLERQIGHIDDEIEHTLKGHFSVQLNLLKGLKGVGTGTKAALMADLPELGTLSEKEIAKLVGVAPLNNDSGKFKGKRTTWGGRARVRAALYMAVLSASRHDAIIKAFYQKLLLAGKPKKVALVACMHKLLTIINAVIKSGKPWQAGYPQATHV